MPGELGRLVARRTCVRLATAFLVISVVGACTTSSQELANSDGESTSSTVVEAEEREAHPVDGSYCVRTRPTDVEGENQPISMELCVSDVAPDLGAQVRVTVVAEDPDAVLFPLNQCAPNTIRFGDEEAECVGVPSCLAPTDDPAPTPGRISETVEHEYSKAGVFTITAILQSGSQCPHPYSSMATLEIRVAVS